MLRRRGNPNWGKAAASIPHMATEFENEMQRLGLTKETCAASPALRLWCEQNKDRVYIPEWLLNRWGMYVDADYSGAA